MQKNNINNDTICALATATGGAIGIIRLSGNRSIEIVNKIFSKNISNAKPNSLHYGEIIRKYNDCIDIIDDVVISIYHTPHSYTGEDSVEISCHGSSYILNKVLELLIDNGCRMALPGEYTQRAFMNGKMDLSQAEAVSDLISSTNQATHRIAMSQLRGCFSSELAQLREKLLKLTSLLELELDFSDHEDLEFADRTELLSIANAIYEQICKLINSFKTGKALKQGIPVAIVGKTNVGKSTLLNQLLKDERAIVSNIHGTTRDVIEDTIDINGVIFRFIDTAGIRNTEDEIEKLGIERTYKKIKEASIIIWLIDERPSNYDINEILELTKGKQLIVVQNKIDLNPNIENETWSCPKVLISAKHNKNIDLLEKHIYKAANIPVIKENNIIVTNTRHYEALKRAKTNINRVIEGLNTNNSGDLIAEDLRLALADLAEITGGQITTQETLSNIFSNFCVGK